MKIRLFVPAESTAPSGEGVVKLPEVPQVNDIIDTWVLSPELGPGCRDHRYRVVSREWNPNGEPLLRLTRVREER